MLDLKMISPLFYEEREHLISHMELVQRISVLETRLHLMARDHGRVRRLEIELTKVKQQLDSLFLVLKLMLIFLGAIAGTHWSDLSKLIGLI